MMHNILQKNDKAKVIICFCFTANGDVVSGDSNGNIYLWEKGRAWTFKISVVF